MNAFDLSPLFRSSVGFERLNQMIDAAMIQLDAVGRLLGVGES